MSKVSKEAKFHEIPTTIIIPGHCHVIFRLLLIWTEHQQTPALTAHVSVWLDIMH